jgi:transmembrane protein
MTTLEYPMTRKPILDAILRSRALDIVGRVLLTFPFWGSGFSKLIDFQAGSAEMAHFGLQPAAAYNALTILVQLGGSALIISRRWTWLGAGALGVFTALTIPIVHHFWSLSGEQATIAFHTATEHVGIIGALVLVSILAVRPR